MPCFETPSWGIPLQFPCNSPKFRCNWLEIPLLVGAAELSRKLLIRLRVLSLKKMLFCCENGVFPGYQGNAAEIHRCRPASTETIDPVVCVKCVIDAITASATS